MCVCSMCVHACVCMHVCACMCVCVRERERASNVLLHYIPATSVYIRNIIYYYTCIERRPVSGFTHCCGASGNHSKVGKDQPTAAI